MRSSGSGELFEARCATQAASWVMKEKRYNQKRAYALARVD